MNARDKNKLLVGVYIGFSMILLNLPNSSIPHHSLGIICLIAGSYGLVCLKEKQKFIFD